MAHTTITVNDGESTPVAHDFVLRREDHDFAQYWDEASGVYAGYPKMSFMVNRPSPENDGRNHRLRMKVVLPILESVDPTAINAQGYKPAPSVAYTLSGEVYLVYPARASLQDKLNMSAYLGNLFAHASAGEFVSQMKVPSL